MKSGGPAEGRGKDGRAESAWRTKVNGESIAVVEEGPPSLTLAMLKVRYQLSHPPPPPPLLLLYAIRALACTHAQCTFPC